MHVTLIALALVGGLFGSMLLFSGAWPARGR